MLFSALTGTLPAKQCLAQITKLTSGRSILQPEGVLSRVHQASEMQLEMGVSASCWGITHPPLSPTTPLCRFRNRSAGRFRLPS